MNQVLVITVWLCNRLAGNNSFVLTVLLFAQKQQKNLLDMWNQLVLSVNRDGNLVWLLIKKGKIQICSPGAGGYETFCGWLIHVTDDYIGLKIELWLFEHLLLKPMWIRGV